MTSLGTKRTCQSCGSKYYDFDKENIECPSCGVAFDPEVLLKSRRIKPVASDKPISSEKEAELVEDVEIDEDIEDEDSIDDENSDIIAVPSKDDDDEAIDGDPAIAEDFLDADEDEDDN